MNLAALGPMQGGALPPEEELEAAVPGASPAAAPRGSPARKRRAGERPPNAHSGAPRDGASGIKEQREGMGRGAPRGQPVSGADASVQPSSALLPVLESARAPSPLPGAGTAMPLGSGKAAGSESGVVAPPLRRCAPGGGSKPGGSAPGMRRWREPATRVPAARRLLTPGGQAALPPRWGP